MNPTEHGSYYREEEFPDVCQICGSYLEWEDCWQCHGDGGFHDCGEDCCMCIDKEEITVDCEVCKGEGGYRICIAASKHPVPANGGGE